LVAAGTENWEEGKGKGDSQTTKKKGYEGEIRHDFPESINPFFVAWGDQEI